MNSMKYKFSIPKLIQFSTIGDQRGISTFKIFTRLEQVYNKF